MRCFYYALASYFKADGTLPDFQHWMNEFIDGGWEGNNQTMSLSDIGKFVAKHDHLDLCISVYLQTSIEQKIINAANFGSGSNHVLLYINENIDYDDTMQEEEEVDRARYERFAEKDGATIDDYDLSSSSSSEEEFDDDDEIRNTERGHRTDGEPTFAEKQDRILPRTRQTKHEARTLGVYRYRCDHYYRIADLQSFLNLKRTHHIPCRFCLALFTSPDCHVKHELLYCVRRHVKTPAPVIELPDQPVQFRQYEAKLPKPFLIFFDFETAAQRTKEGEKESDSEEDEQEEEEEEVRLARDNARHPSEIDDKATFVPISYCIVVLQRERIYKKYYHAASGGVVKHFLNRILKIRQRIEKKMQHKAKMINAPPPPKDQTKEQCHICEKPFDPADILVLDHDHFDHAPKSGTNFRGYAHRECNLRYQDAGKLVPAIAHSGASFDFQLLG